MKTHLQIVVRSTEIDVNGHVNNAKYLEYFEWGREEWYDQAGLSYQTFQQSGIHTVVVQIRINYRKECKQGDVLTISCEPLSIGNSSYRFLQEIVNQNLERCADAEVTCVTVDVESRKSRVAPDVLRNFFPLSPQS